MWEKWLENYCRIVCNNNASYKAMWGEWRKRLEVFSRDDLDKAAEWFVTSWYPSHPEAQWGSHPGALFGKLKQIYEERKRREHADSYKDKPMSFAAEGRRSKTVQALRGIGLEKIKDEAS